MNSNIGRVPWRRSDLARLASHAAQQRRLLWTAADRDLEVEVVAVRGIDGDAKVYFGAAEELRTIALVPPLCPAGVNDAGLRLAARTGVLQALAPDQLATLRHVARGPKSDSVGDFVAMALPEPPSLRADLAALYTAIEAEGGQLCASLPTLVCAFRVPELDLEAVCFRNAAEVPLVRFGTCPPSRSHFLPDIARDNPREGVQLLRALLLTESATTRAA